MDKQFILKLLKKFNNGNLTEEERKFLESYYDLFENEPDNLTNLDKDEKAKLKNSLKATIWSQMSANESHTTKVRRIRGIYIKVAAAVFIGIIGSVFFYNSLLSKKPTDKNVAVNEIRQKPGQEKAAAGPVENANRVIFLPDGSSVTLSPGSKLNYPSSFDGLKRRVVFLEGQAFFDVKHNASRPFVVHTGKLETIVLGTAFNIKAINGESEITITVKRGKVKVKDQQKVLGTITPNQQITYDKKKVSSILQVVKNDSYLNWKDQDLFIDNLTLSEAAKILEEQFKITIKISDSSIMEQRFTATFPKNETLEQELKSISIFNGLIYTYNHDKSEVIISRQKLKL